MGFELSVVTTIFFISAVLLGTYSYTTLTTSSEIVGDASEEQYEMQQMKLQTDLDIDDSLPNTSGSDYELTVMLSNTGSESIRFDRLNVLIDGELEYYSYADTTYTWTPSESRNLTITGLSGLGVHRVKVVTENGISAYDVYLV